MNIHHTFRSFHLIFNRVFKIASRLEPKYIPVWKPDGSLPDRPFVIIIPVCFLIFSDKAPISTQAFIYGQFIRLLLNNNLLPLVAIFFNLSPRQ